MSGQVAVVAAVAAAQGKFVVVDTVHFELGIECIVEIVVAAGSFVLYIAGLVAVDYMLLGMPSLAMDQLEEGRWDRRLGLHSRNLESEETGNLLAVGEDTARLGSLDIDSC